ncbi:MAG: winged helix-turn-helix transcriptional regulator [Geodermatophilaceae bacterium]|nr:winged helix-turn-helix transcriptional regulator [Geodermatophilaceae bacterium]
MATPDSVRAHVPDVERRPATEAQARALASGTRLRILRLCLSEALSNKEIATHLRRHPASVLHHVRTLVDTGFLVAEPVRRGSRGAREVPYRATGLSWKVDLADQRASRQDAALEAFLEEVALVGQAQLQSTRLGLRLPPEEIEEFRERLQQLLDEFAHRPMDPAGLRWSVYFGIHPEPGPTSD